MLVAYPTPSGKCSVMNFIFVVVSVDTFPLSTLIKTNSMCLIPFFTVPILLLLFYLALIVQG